MRKVAKAIKGTSTHAIDRKLHSHEAVWQEESFDHVLRSSESLDAKIDYVLQNPVRKGLVRMQANLRGRGGSQWIIRTGHVGAGALTRPAMRSIARRWRSSGKALWTTTTERFLAIWFLPSRTDSRLKHSFET